MKYIGLLHLYRSFFVAFMHFIVPVPLNKDHYFSKCCYENNTFHCYKAQSVFFSPLFVTNNVLQMLFLTNSIWTPGNLVPHPVITFNEGASSSWMS